MSRLTLYDHLGLPKVRYPYLTEFEFMLKELQHYKDLEEQGLLVELPCKMGDTIYYVFEPLVGKPHVRETVFSYFWLDYEIFLTKEEAEAKLAELKEV